MSLSVTKLYRAYLHHLRLLPDPHVWAVAVPRFRALLDKGRFKSSNPPLSGEDEAASSSKIGRRPPGEEMRHLDFERKRAEKYLKKAHKQLDRLRAAVACHPHALKRLLEEAYGQRGVLRWNLLSNVIKSSSSPVDIPNPRPAIPPSLLPLLPPPAISTRADATPRARTRIPDTAIRKAAKKAWERDRKELKVPIPLPRRHDLINSFYGGERYPATGWEDERIVQNLRLFAGLTDGLLDTSYLPSRLRRIFPRRTGATYRDCLPPYPAPPPRATRSNPTTWHAQRVLTPRLVRRIYRRLWDSLNWVRPDVSRVQDIQGTDVEVKWIKCSWQEMEDWKNEAENFVGQEKGRGKRKGSSGDGRMLEQYSLADEEERFWCKPIKQGEELI